MPRIDTIHFRCLDPEAQKAFFQQTLGMGLREDGAVAYDHQQAGLKFAPCDGPYNPTGNDIYWKIALAVPNIELAYEQLVHHDVAVSVPRQFQQIGYLAHFKDPEGFTIELIEHWFRGNRPKGEHDPSLLGGGASLNLLTLRCHDITPLRADCLSWGMTPLSVQPVTDHGFTLHFFAFTDETPPNPDLTSVQNREWLYQRPYTVLEIQEIHDADPMTATPPQQGGYEACKLSDTQAPIRSAPLLIST